MHNTPDPPRVIRINLDLSQSQVKQYLPSTDIAYQRKAESIPTNSWFNITSTSNLIDQPNRFDNTLTSSCNSVNPGFRSRKYRLNLTSTFKQIILHNLAASRIVYNKCIQLCFRGPPDDRVKPDLTTLRRLVSNRTATTLTDRQKAICNTVPTDILSESIRDFIKNYNILLEQRKSGTIRKFNMKYRRRNGSLQQSLVINHRFFNKNNNGEYYCFPTFWNREIFRTYGEQLPNNITNAVRLIVTSDNKFYLAIPSPATITPKHKTYKAVSLDPGVRTFQTTYDTSGHSFSIGSTSDHQMDRLARRAAKIRAGIKRVYTNYTSENRDRSTKTYVTVTTKREKKGLMKAAARLERKISNRINDLHKKTAKFLCDNYDTIIIPKFETSNMARRRNRTRRRIINRGTTRRMLRWSHYKFRTYLKEKGELTSTNIVEGTEEYTSKTCTKCCQINEKLGGNKTFNCPNKRCNYKGDRDISAARNIMILNWERAGLFGLSGS